jgi:membrane protease YdiL (CAAX protease family)
MPAHLDRKRQNSNLSSLLQILLFFAVACGSSWSIWLWALAAGAASAGSQDLVLLGALGPTFAAFVVSGVLEGAQARNSLLLRLMHYRVRARWYLMALLLPLLPAVFAVLVYAGLGGVQTGVVVLPAPTVGLSSAIVLWPLLEEAGWRGFAFLRLRRRFGLLTSGILVGLLWGVWLAPLILLPGADRYSLAARYGVLPLVLAAILVWTAALSVLLGCLVSRAGGSVVVAIVGHAVGLAGLFGFVVPAALQGSWWIVVLYLLILVGVSLLTFEMLRSRA